MDIAQLNLPRLAFSFIKDAQKKRSSLPIQFCGWLS